MSVNVIPAPAGSGGGKTKRVQQFLSSGTWTVPSGVKAAHVICVGGGGAGGSMAGGSPCAGGGGGGQYWEGDVDVSGAASVTVTVAAGGAAPTAPTGTGNIGGTSSFGSLSVSASGGGSGGYAGTSNFGTPGATTGGGCGISNTGGGGGGAGGNARGIVTAPNLGSTNFCVTEVPLVAGAKHGGLGQYPYDPGTNTVKYYGSPDGGPGINGYGGGGGGVWSNPVTLGTGVDGGGNGNYYGAVAGSGQPNTGGGGGGGAFTSSSVPMGGAGGSGIVIVSWEE